MEHTQNIDLNQKLKKEYETFKKNIRKPNILIIGATGVGKSSLINRVFGEKVADIGAGMPVTSGINKYEKDELDVVLFDSEGYELGNEQQERFRTKVINFIDKNEINPDKQIHLVWYCIAAPNHRITELDEKIISEIDEMGKPIAVVFTKCDAVTVGEIENLEKIIETLAIKSFRVTTVENQDLNFLELNELIKWSRDHLTDEVLRCAFTKSQIANLELKKKETERIIKLHTTGSAFVGFTPIPFSDAPLLLANQAGMVSRILYVYNLENLGSTIPGLITKIGVGTIISSIGINAASYLTSQLLKLIPGLGTIAGGLINGSVAALITAAIGYTVSEIAYTISKYSINGEVELLAEYLNNLEPIFKKEFSKNLKTLSKKETYKVTGNGKSQV